MWNNLFGIKPRTGGHGDRLQLMYPLLYSPHIDTLLQDNEEELDSHVWYDKPWRSMLRVIPRRNFPRTWTFFE